MSREPPRSFLLNATAFILIFLCLIQTACTNTPSDEQQHEYITLKKSLNNGGNQQTNGDRRKRSSNQSIPEDKNRDKGFYKIKTEPIEAKSEGGDSKKPNEDTPIPFSPGMSIALRDNNVADGQRLKVPSSLVQTTHAPNKTQQDKIYAQDSRHNEVVVKGQDIPQADPLAANSPIKPDRFEVKLKEVNHSNSKKYFVFVHVTPGSKGMRLEEFSITASVVGDQGELRGVGSRKKSGKGFQYNRTISNTDPISLTELYVISSNCSGKDDTTFESDNTATFKLSYTPDGQQKNKYQLVVTVKRKGSNIHSETAEIFLLPK